MKKILSILLLYFCFSATNLFAQCDISFSDYLNTGSNHTVFLTPGAIEGTPLSSGDDIGVFYISDDGSAQCAGYSIWNGYQLQITVFGDDTTTDEIDGVTSGAPLLLLAQSGDDVYIVSASYQTPSMSSFVVNGISFVVGLSFEIGCPNGISGCTDSAYLEYDETANTDDGSCTSLPVSGCTDLNYVEYNSSANVDDGSCLTVSLDGCTDTSASNYNDEATNNDGTCIYPGCTNPGYLQYWNYDLALIDNNTYFVLTTLVNPNVNQDNGTCYTSLNFGCVFSDFLEYDPSSNVYDLSYCQTYIVEGCIDQLAFNYNNVANTDDGSCYPIVEGCMDETAFNYIEITGDVFIDINTNNQEMCIPVIYGCLDSLAYNYNNYDGDGEYNEFTGIPSIDVNTGDSSCIERVYGCLDNHYIEYNELANTDNGSCENLYSIAYYEVIQENLNLNNTIEEATTSLSSLEQALDTWNTTINLSEGWNMFGYGCPEPIDVIEGLSNHTESINLAKDNNGSVYWPEFEFNGIGDLTPGFGYQIKVIEAIEGFSLCDWYVNDIPVDNIVSLQEEIQDLQEDLSSVIKIGDEVFGGIVFHVDSSGLHGLIAYSNDFEFEWEEGITFCNNFEFDSFDDWYLPSISELVLMHLSIGVGTSYEYLSNLDDYTYYWSSTQSNPWAWTYRHPIGGYQAGVQDGSSLGNNFLVRPIRSF